MIATVSCDKPCLFSMGTVYFDETLFCLVNVPPSIEAGASCFNENSTTDSEELWRLTHSPQA